jgi:hypothetical protein
VGQMSDEFVDAEVVPYKFVGPDYVLVRIDDGTEMKITLNCEVLKAKDQKSPDGRPKYHANIGMNVTFKAPVGRTVKVPKSMFGQHSLPTKPKDSRQIA